MQWKAELDSLYSGMPLEELALSLDEQIKENEERNEFDETIVKHRSWINIIINNARKNDSDLQRHEKELFKLKECERESNK